MNYKSSIILLILIFILSISVAGAEVQVEDIQELIAKGRHEQALKILEENDISGNPDLKYLQAVLWSWEKEYGKAEERLKSLIKDYPKRLDFYDQLARIYGWMGKYEEAEKLINKAQSLKIAASRTAILAKHAEWQNKGFKAKKLWEKAVEQADDAEIKEKYKASLARVKKKTKSHFYWEISAQHKEELEGKFLLGQRIPAPGGKTLQVGAGLNRDQEEFAEVLEAELELSPIWFLENMELELIAELMAGEDKEKRKYNSIFTYKLKKRRRLIFDLESVNTEEENQDNQYQTLTVEYSHKFKKMTGYIKTAARHNQEGWNWNFSHHAGVYYPVKQYLFNLQAGYYPDGDYTLRFGIELSDLALSTDWVLHSLNGWFNSEEVKNLDLTIYSRP